MIINRSRIYIDYPGLTFDDILIQPNVNTDIDSRDQVDLKVHFSRNVEIDLPLVISPMDSVSNEITCRIMSENGSIGILHRFWERGEDFTRALTYLTTNKVRYAMAVGIKDSQSILDKVFSGKYQEPVALVVDVAHGGMKKAIE
jgi:hypothetical protein